MPVRSNKARAVTVARTLPARLVDLSTTLASQLEAGPFDHAVFTGGLPDFDCLVFGHGCKPLRLCISGPPNLQAGDLRRFAQPQVLFQRRGAERPAASHGPI